MGRSRTRLEHCGDISYTAVRKAGKITGWRARAMYRDIDGELRPVERTGASKSKAKDRLTEALEDRYRATGVDAKITGDSTLLEIAAEFIIECELDPGRSRRSIDVYKQELYAADINDKRTTATDSKIIVAMGAIRARELTTPRVDMHINSILLAGSPSKAKRHKMILENMMALAVRHGAIKDNPVKDMRTIRSNRGKTTALEVQQLQSLRTHLQMWARGEAVPGCPAFKSGFPRNPKLVHAANLLLGTGARPGEILGLRRCDIDMTGSIWTARICGTLVYIKGESTARQDYTKTGETGARVVSLPGFAMETLIALGAMKWELGDEELIITDRNGNPWNMNNFRRLWRQARGSDYAWVTPKTFRATVATLIAAETDVATAAHQLGHVIGSKVTEQHYLVRNQLAPDSSSILDKAVNR